MWFCAIIEYWNQQKDKHINELSRLLPVLAPVNGALIQCIRSEGKTVNWTHSVLLRRCVWRCSFELEVGEHRHRLGQV